MTDDEEGLKRSIELPPDSSDDKPDFDAPLGPPSIQWEIKMENTTAGTSSADSQAIKMLQILDKGLILEVPEKTCAAGHHVALKIKGIGIPNLDLQFNATGKVESAERFPDHTDQIQIKLIQYPEGAWDALQRVIAERQEQLVKFLADVGGR